MRPYIDIHGKNQTTTNLQNFPFLYWSYEESKTVPPNLAPRSPISVAPTSPFYVDILLLFIFNANYNG